MFPSTLFFVQHHQMLMSARGQQKGAPERQLSPQRRPQTAGEGKSWAPDGAWIPAGVRPHSPPRQQLTGGLLSRTRRNRAIEHTHLFLDNPELPPDDPSNFFWLYGAFDFKMQCPYEQAQSTAFKTIDRLVDRMNKHAPGASQQQQTASIPGMPNPPPECKSKAKQAAPPPLKAHLIFDIISTKKHLGPVPTKGLPYQLGTDIYEHVERTHNTQIVTTFVGLTDNTARRVGRDVYYTQSDELSKNRMPFSMIDKQHLFVVFPNPSDHSVGK